MNTPAAAAGMILRQYRPNDLAAVVGIYRDAVRSLGPLAYDSRQVEVWARFPEDVAAFGQALSEGVTLLVDCDGVPAAFGQLRPAGHVQYLYCRGECARRGFATALLRELETQARGAGEQRLTTDASRLSRPLFAREGFEIEATETVDRHGVSFERFRMAKRLTLDKARAGRKS